MQLDMERTDWNPKKPYDLRERLFEFGCLVIRLVQHDPVIKESDELVRIVATVIRKAEGGS